MNDSMKYAYQVACTLANSDWEPHGSESIEQRLDRCLGAYFFQRRLPKIALMIALAVRPVMLVMLLARFAKPAWPVLWQVGLACAVWKAIESLWPAP